MNNQRRKQIQELIDQVQNFQSTIEDLDIDSIRSEEQDYRDNMPENLQFGDRAQASDDAISNLDDAESALDDIKNSLDTLINALEAAKE